MAGTTPCRPEREGVEMKTFLNFTHGTTAGYTRSTSNGYYTSLSPDFIRALSPEDLPPESCEQALEKRVLLPQLRQARGIQLKTPNSVHDKVDLLLLAAEASERGEAKGTEAWETLAHKQRTTARLTRGEGGVHPSPWKAIARQPPMTSVITEQANLEVSHLMRAVLEGEGQGNLSKSAWDSRSLAHGRAQDLPPPATIEEAAARLQQRNLQRGLDKVEEEIRAAKMASENKAAFLGKIKDPSPHLCEVPLHKGGVKQGIKSKSLRQRRDELGEKINQLRRSQNKLLIFQEELELRKAEATHHLFEHGNYLHDNCRKVANGYYAFEGQEHRVLSKIAMDQARASEIRSKRREILVSRKAAIVQSIDERAEQNLIYKQERVRKETQRAKSNWQQVVLPAILAALRMVIWSKCLETGRAWRQHQKEVAAANRIRAVFFLMKKKREAHRKSQMRVFLRKRIWRMKMHQRIRLKRLARQVLIPFFRSNCHKRRVALAVSRYVWKIKKLQQHVRSVLACRHAQLRAVMAQWDQICQVRRTIQLDKHGENTQWGGGARTDLPSASPPVPAPNLLRQQTMSFRASLARKKTLTFDTINFLMLPGAEDPLVKALLDQALSDRRNEFMKTLMEWRDEYQSWQDEKKYYRLEIEAHQEMLRKGGKPVWQTGDSKVKLIKRSVPRTLSEHFLRLPSSPGSPKTGRDDSSDAEDEEIRTDGRAGSPVRDWEGEDCEGGATENNMVDGDLTSEKEGSAEIEPATPLSSEIGKRGSEKSPCSPLTASSKGKQHHFHKEKKSTRQDVAAEEIEKKTWSYQTWKDMPAVDRFAHIRYKIEGPPRPMFHFKLSEKDDILLLMHHVRHLNAMGP